MSNTLNQSETVQRLSQYLESRGFKTTFADLEEMQAILEGSPSASTRVTPRKTRHNYRVVELDPADVAADSQVVVEQSKSNPTLVSGDYYSEVVEQASRLARETLNRPMLVLDANDALRETVDEGDLDSLGDYGLYVTEGPILDPEADRRDDLSNHLRRVRGGFGVLRNAYGSFTSFLGSYRGDPEYTDAMLFIANHKDGVHSIIHRAAI